MLVKTQNDVRHDGAFYARGKPVARLRPTIVFGVFFFLFLRRMSKNLPKLPRIKYMSCVPLTRCSRCNGSSRCRCYLVRRDPLRCDSRPDIPSSPGGVGLARAQAITKTQAMKPSRQTRGPVTAHPTRWGVGPQTFFFCYLKYVFFFLCHLKSAIAMVLTYTRKIYACRQWDCASRL